MRQCPSLVNRLGWLYLLLDDVHFSHFPFSLFNPSIHPSVHPSIHPSICPSLCPKLIHRYFCLILASPFLFFILSPSCFLHFCLAVCLSVCLLLYFFVLSCCTSCETVELNGMVCHPTPKYHAGYYALFTY